MAPKKQNLSDEERDFLAAYMGKETWEDLSTDEKRKAAGYGGAAHRQGLTIDQAWLDEHGSAPASTGGRKKK